MPTDRKIAPAIHDAVSFNFSLPAIQKHVFPNQIPLYWIDSSVQDVIEIDWVFPAGIWYEPLPMVSQAVAALFKNGTSRRSANELNEALEFYGASFRVIPGNDYATVTLHALTRHLPDILPVIQEILTEAVFPEEELEIFKTNAVQRLLVSLRQGEFVANQQMDALLFGENHPYGRYTKKEAIEALTRADLQAFYKKNYDIGQVQIFMAGKFGKKEIDLLEEAFGRQEIYASSIPYMPAPSPAPSGQKLHLDHDPQGVQGAIRIGRLFPNRLHPDFAPMVVLNTVLGGYFGSRLMRNIREEKGFTYGIYSALSSYIHGGSFVIHTETGREVTMAAVSEIYHEMERLCREPIPEEELALVKNYLLGNLLGELDGPFQVLQRWRSLILNGLKEEDFHNNVNTYKMMTSKRLHELARQYFLPEQFYEVVVM